MRGIKADGAGFLAPGLAIDSLAGEAGVEQCTDRKHISQLIDFLAAVNLRCGIPVVENRFALQFVVITDVIETGQPDSAVLCEYHRRGTDIIEASTTPVQKARRLANLNHHID